ncbi:hypothetical protein GCM10027040_22700 [Halomonas shantousis]
MTREGKSLIGQQEALPESLPPQALKSDNPLKLKRLVDGKRES